MDLFGKKASAQVVLLESEKQELAEKIISLEELLTPEMKDVIAIKSAILNLEIQKAKIENEISTKQQEILCQQASIDGLKQKANNLADEIIVNEEIIELESFALYKPKYNFVNSDDYKEALSINREKQKSMIKNGTACLGAQGWTVNNSAAQGKKLVNDMIKLCLRSFNNECDASVSLVKFNNFDRCNSRIEKSSDAIEKLGKMMSINIAPTYTKLKKEELSIALEYQVKKQEEKEALKELRAQQREEARVAKEIEEARKTAEKEQKHYNNALSNIEKQILECTNADEKALLLEKENDLKSRLENISNNIKALDYREANQKAGYVYVISNIGAFGDNVYKIGMTRRLEPEERVDELGDASVPFNFDIHAMIFSENAPKLENALHKAFEGSKLNMVNTRREFFNVTLDEIKKVVKDNHDKTVEFINTPSAEQYRESLKLKK